MKNQNSVRKVLSLVLVFVLVVSIFSDFQVGFALGEGGNVIGAGRGTTFYITSDATLWGLGDNEFAQVGNGTKENEILQPVMVLKDVSNVASGSTVTFALKNDHTLWGWGFDLRLFNDNYATSPEKLMDDVQMVVTNASNQVYVIKTDGTLLTKGANSNLDSIKKEATDEWVQVPGSGKVKYVFSSSNTFYINEEDELWGWGTNTNGSLGVGQDDVVYDAPLKIMDDVQSVTGSNNNTMIIRKDGSLWMCGRGNNGDFYDGSKIIKSDTSAGFVNVPVKIMENILQAAVGSNDFYVVKRDYTLWGWGDNRKKIINPSSPLKVDAPVQILSGVHQVVCGERHIVIAKTDNTVWTGGENYRGGISGEVIGKTTTFPLRKTASGLLDVPASWALAEVREAEYRKLVPVAMQSDYTKTVNRSEFCTLAITCIEQAQEMTIEAFLTSKGIEIPTSTPFTDISSLSERAKKDIMAAYALQIVAGTSATTFDPYKPITREQAAKMLTSTASTLGEKTDATTPTFADGDKIATWAKPFIGYVVDAKIMGGVGNNRFDAKGGYQRQQAYVTVLRVYKKVTGIE
ncbi:S-layer homology domain-containing protein [Fusibacter bizertensis]